MIPIKFQNDIFNKEVIMKHWLRFNLNYLLFSILVLLIVSCTSQEYTTAKLAIQQSDWTKAEEWLPKAMAVEQDNPEIPIVYAIEIHARNENWKEMVILLQKALSMDPNKKVEVKGQYFAVSEHVKNYTDTYWGNVFNEGVEKINKSQKITEEKNKYLKEAIEKFINATIIKPSDAQAYVNIAIIYMNELKDTTNAIKYSKMAIASDPMDFNANYRGGQIMENAKLPGEEIIPFYQKAIQIDPSNSNALRALAGLYYQIGDNDNAIKIFRDAIEKVNDQKIKADLYFNLGIIYNQLGKYDEGEAAYEEASYLNEEDYEAIEGMAITYMNLGENYLKGSDGFEKDLDKAAKWFRKAEKKYKYVRSLDPDNEDKYNSQLKIVRYQRGIAEGD